MTPSMSSCANARRTVPVDELAHVPSVVPRTVMVTASPPRFWLAMKLHMAGSSASSQPPEATGAGCSVSMVCVAHLVTTCMSVTLFVKSTSNSLKAAPNGVHITEMTFMFGGTSTPSYG
jgi:hypothetical protein